MSLTTDIGLNSLCFQTFPLWDGSTYSPFPPAPDLPETADYTGDPPQPVVYYSLPSASSDSFQNVVGPDTYHNIPLDKGKAMEFLWRVSEVSVQANGVKSGFTDDDEISGGATLNRLQRYTNDYEFTGIEDVSEGTQLPRDLVCGIPPAFDAPSWDYYRYAIWGTDSVAGPMLSIVSPFLGGFNSQQDGDLQDIVSVGNHAKDNSGQIWTGLAISAYSNWNYGTTTGMRILPYKFKARSYWYKYNEDSENPLYELTITEEEAVPSGINVDCFGNQVPLYQIFTNWDGQIISNPTSGSVTISVANYYTY